MSLAMTLNAHMMIMTNNEMVKIVTPRSPYQCWDWPTYLVWFARCIPINTTLKGEGWEGGEMDD